jgi:hypothetical protein
MKTKKCLTYCLVFFLYMVFIGVSAFSKGLPDDTYIVKQKIENLGFKVGKMAKLKNGTYEAEILGFQQKTGFLALPPGESFTPFTLHASYMKNNLYVLGADLKNYKINKRLQSSSIKLVVKLPGFVPIGPIKPIFSQLDHGDVEMSPPVLLITYGGQILNLNNGGNGGIQIPENSDLIRPGDKIRVSVKFTLRNRMNKAFKFQVYLKYGVPGDPAIALGEVTLYKQGTANSTKTVSKTVELKAYGTQYKPIIIHGPVGISDDTHISFFHASLMVRIYAI